MSSRRPITRAKAKRILEAPLIDAIDLINQFSLEDEIPSESISAEPARSPTTDFFDSEEDIMSYPYPRYNGEADAEAHIRAYMTTWQANHVSKRFGLVETNISKIAEFGLSLDRQATRSRSSPTSTNSRKNLSNYSIEASRNGT